MHANSQFNSKHEDVVTELWGIYFLEMTSVKSEVLAGFWLKGVLSRIIHVYTMYKISLRSCLNT